MPEIHLVACGVADPEHGGKVPTIAIRHLPCVLGRASACDHRIDDPMISRRHCAFSFRDGQVWVEDLASRNGTRIDGEPVQSPRPVADGATLQLARLTFVIRQEGSGRAGGREGEPAA
jgi:pSer/pThr/pTyr-binding forkhead associated (FHA) protein